MRKPDKIQKEEFQKIKKSWEQDEMVEMISQSPEVISIILYKRKEMLEQKLAEIIKQLSKAPEGTLRISRANYTQYYHRVDTKNTCGQYIQKDQIELVKELAQKEYNQKISKEIAQEMNIIDHFLKVYEPEKIDSVYQNLNLERQALVTPLTISDAEYIDAWKKVDYPRKGFWDDDIEIYSDAGERVRSKSEVIIANKLFQMGVPYRYEYPIKLASGRRVAPDFYCLNIRKRQEFVYEHFGMMDQLEYADKAIKKIIEYQQSGYWLGKNLIVSFETSNKVLNVRELEDMLKQYLL